MNATILCTAVTPTTAVAPAPANHFAARLELELNPVTALELLVTREIAHDAALLERLDGALDSLQGNGVAALAEVLSDAPDVIAASVLATDRHDRLLRQRHATSRSLLRAINELGQLRRESWDSWGDRLQLDPRFVSEGACLAHLGRRYAQGRCACQRCGAAGQGSVLFGRQCWQCNACQAQTGLRRGTCMERSALRLVPWFAAIRATVLMPGVPVAELARFLHIARTQTVCQMVRKIHAALDSADPSLRLAGLAELYLGGY